MPVKFKNLKIRCVALHLQHFAFLVSLVALDSQQEVNIDKTRVMEENGPAYQCRPIILQKSNNVFLKGKHRSVSIKQCGQFGQNFAICAKMFCFGRIFVRSFLLWANFFGKITCFGQFFLKIWANFWTKFMYYWATFFRDLVDFFQTIWSHCNKIGNEARVHER